MVIEICANSATSCIEAQRGGANRVELCAAIPEGGTTPSLGEIVIARKSIKIPLNVIIRPRSGDFLYNENEFEAMLLDIEAAKKAGADGVVFGCLLADGSIDMARNKILIEHSTGLSTTFHRAFDVCKDPYAAMEQLIELKFDRILTSGQQATALQGSELIAKLITKANGRIIIMPGCGINEQNIAQIKQTTAAKEFHLSVRERIDSKMEFRNNLVSMGGTVNIDEFAQDITSSERVKNTISNITW